MLNRIITGLLLFTLSACASTDVHTDVTPMIGGLAGDTKRIYIVTNREPAADKSLRYGPERADKLSFGESRIWIPTDREPGHVKNPKGEIDFAKEFAVIDYKDHASQEAFINSINTALKYLPEGQPKSVFLFIHGYNVGFGDGLYRNAQIIHDFGSDAVAVYFSWPSAARLTQYLYDRDSAQFSRDSLVETLELLSKTDAKNIAILAHSMGTHVTMEALRDLSHQGRADILNRIDPLALASPDIDEDVFETQYNAIDPKPEPFVVFVSSKDRALKLSTTLRGGEARLGIGKNIDKLREMGIYVVDMSVVKDGKDNARHVTFASSPTMLRIVNDGTLSRATLNSAEREQDGEEDAVNSLTGLAKSIILLPFTVLEQASGQ